MGLYILRRLVLLVPLWLGVTLLTFAMIQLIPGDPVVLMLGPRATPERAAALRDQLGLNDPFLVQYGRYIVRVLRGDLGTSIRGGTPVLDEILLRLPSTLQLAGAGLALSVSAGLAVGAIAAITPIRRLDRTLMIISAAGLSVPIFWLAPILILFFGVRLRWVPVSGGAGWQALVLPGVAIAIAPAAVLARVTRASILQVAQQDYVRTARAKGLRERHVSMRHVLPNALLPIITVIGLLASTLITGTVFIEVIFGRPGLGRLTVNAVLNRDFPQIQGVVLFTTVVYVMINLLVDVLYTVVDPRVHNR